MKNWLVGAFLLLAESSIPTSSLSSESASYDGNALVLHGNVQLTHTLGEMQANFARLVRKEKNDTLSSIHLKKDVIIELKNRGKIVCDRADFDFEKLEGKLLPKPGQSIELTEFPSNLSLSANGATLTLLENHDSFTIKELIATDQVHIHYGPDFALEMMSASYREDPIAHIQINTPCTLTHYKDIMNAENAKLFCETPKAIFKSVEGNFPSLAFSKGDDLLMRCDTLIWEQQPKTFSLIGNICIEEEGVLSIFCEERATFHQKEEEVFHLQTKGKTRVNYILDKLHTHRLACEDGMEIDQNLKTLTMQGSEKAPIVYFYDAMQLTADFAKLYYFEKKPQFSPKKLHLKRNIRLFTDESTRRCAIAEEFLYFPQEKKAILKAGEENVLFWDESQELSISAKEVHITQTEKGETIKGVGNVRFAFSSIENELLKRLFPFYTSKRGPS